GTRRQDVGDALRPVRLGPVGGDQIRIGARHDLVVGIDQHTRWRIDHLRQFGEGYPTEPIVFASPPRARQQAVARAADGHPAWRIEADGAAGVGVYDVLLWRVEIAKRINELPPIF